jgi:pimeloyl-ACP methyl ester carboxylesterase
VLVAGFGSTSQGADVLDVDTGALGYANQDVAQFSYAGGRTPGTGALAGVPVNEYGPEHSTADLEEAAKRMGELIDAIAVAHPGVPIDVIGHSQGGVVARLALRGGPPVAHLVTLGAPHHGADLATANALLGTTEVGDVTQEIAGEVTDGAADGASRAAAQLSERPAPFDTFRIIPLPAGTRVTSIAARGDLVVAGLQSPLEGATNVMVPIDGISAHSELPGSTLTQRELALALAGLGPTCRDITGDLATAAGISMAEDVLGLAAGMGARWLDRKARVPDGFSRRNRAPGQPGPASAPAGGG